ncbi:MAG: hypothetical protein HC906_00175 [Bacteroidales bacterium]|nr:hypothetical protein [Bacteroidales bacterium]
MKFHQMLYFWSMKMMRSLRNEKYLGKVIVVSGTVNKISQNDTEFSIYLKEENESSGIICGFNPEAVPQNILTGSKVKVRVFVPDTFLTWFE